MRMRRLRRLEFVEANVEALPFDRRCAHAVDLMIAATALAHERPLYTRNAKDLHGLEELIEVVDLDS
jgi:predicted nucleic acid-binding protein